MGSSVLSPNGSVAAPGVVAHVAVGIAQVRRVAPGAAGVAAEEASEVRVHIPRTVVIEPGFLVVTPPGEQIWIAQRGAGQRGAVARIERRRAKVAIFDRNFADCFNEVIGLLLPSRGGLPATLPGVAAGKLP